MKKINFGIRYDLQAAIRHEPNACNGFVMDPSLGCPHQGKGRPNGSLRMQGSKA